MEKTNKKFSDSTVLVSGGAGFIGSNFIRYILSRHPKIKIINFDKLTYAGNLENLKDIAPNIRYKFIKGDIADKKAIQNLFQKYKPEYVINLAAETHVDRSIHLGARSFVKTNIEGVFNILEAIKNSGRIKKFIQVSTDEVYGSLNLDSKSKFKESGELKPNSPYAASKAAGDLLCRAYHSTWG